MRTYHFPFHLARVFPDFYFVIVPKVDHKDYLCEDSRLLETIHSLTKRLVLKKAASGGWNLRLDRTLEPWMFYGL